MVLQIKIPEPPTYTNKAELQKEVNSMRIRIKRKMRLKGSIFLPRFIFKQVIENVQI